MFDVAIYTDTRANEAIDGIDGFNFQAISEGITAQDRQGYPQQHASPCGCGLER